MDPEKALELWIRHAIGKELTASMIHQLSLLLLALLTKFLARESEETLTRLQAELEGQGATKQ